MCTYKILSPSCYPQVVGLCLVGVVHPLGFVICPEGMLVHGKLFYRLNLGILWFGWLQCCTKITCMHEGRSAMMKNDIDSGIPSHTQSLCSCMILYRLWQCLSPLLLWPSLINKQTRSLLIVMHADVYSLLPIYYGNLHNDDKKLCTLRPPYSGNLPTLKYGHWSHAPTVKVTILKTVSCKSDLLV